MRGTPSSRRAPVGWHQFLRSRNATLGPFGLALLVSALTACAGAQDAARGDGGDGRESGSSSTRGDALACAQAKDYEDEARRVAFSVRNPLSDDFEVQKEYERQRSAASQEEQRLRKLAATARQVCEGTSASAAVQAAPPSSAASPENGYFSPYGEQAEAEVTPPAEVIEERAVAGTFPIKVEQNDFDIPKDYTVTALRLTGSDTLTLQGVIQAGTRCASGLEVRVDVTNSGAPFTGASATVTVAAGGTEEAVWDLQVSPDSYDAKTMAFSFEAVWLHGTC